MSSFSVPIERTMSANLLFGPAVAIVDLATSENYDRWRLVEVLPNTRTRVVLGDEVGWQLSGEAWLEVDAAFRRLAELVPTWEGRCVSITQTLEEFIVTLEPDVASIALGRDVVVRLRQAARDAGI